MTTWYIAGPMTGIEDYNYPAFHAAEAMLRERYPDDEIINPATQFDGDQTLPRVVYLRRAVENVLRADRVFTLDRWITSDGACLEVLIARQIGVEVWHTGPRWPIACRNWEGVDEDYAIAGMELRRRAVRETGN